MSRLLIVNSNVVLLDRILENHAVVCQDGIITTVIAGSEISRCCDDEVIDAHGGFLSPGFIDLHIHGLHELIIDKGPDHLISICNLLPRYGVTGFLPTVCPLPKGKDAEFLSKLSRVESDGAQILGFHLEGPFLAITGALPPEALGNADLDRVKNLINAAKPYKAVFSISPEFDGIAELIPTMAEGNSPVFITHTKANVKQTVDAINAGASHATHFYDVFYPPAETERGVRPCGSVEAIMAAKNVSVDFILDGVHVEPIAVKMALECKGNDKVCLITDANIGADLGKGRYKFGNDEIEVECQGAPARKVRTGGLAGSGLTLDRAVRNAVKMLGADIPQAVRMASANPAQVLRLRNKGRIEEGFDADLILLDKDLNVIQTWVKGICCFNHQNSKK